MKNFEKVLSKTVASVYNAQPSRQLTPYTRMPAHGHTWMRPQGAQPLTYGFAIRKPLRKVYQTTGMQSIPEHHVNWGIGLRGFIKRGVAL